MDLSFVIDDTFYLVMMIFFLINKFKRILINDRIPPCVLDPSPIKKCSSLTYPGAEGFVFCGGSEGRRTFDTDGSLLAASVTGVTEGSTVEASTRSVLIGG